MSLYVDIEKQLGTFHLRVRFETEGEVMALLGASGCGKSMTLKCIAGVERPDLGRIVLNGRTLFDSEERVCLTPQQRRVGYLFQQYALFPHMTVEQNLAAALWAKPRGERRAAVADKVRAFHLEGLERHRPCQLSGGQQQRLALARMLAGEPEALLLDEPFSALDSYLKWQLELDLMDMLGAFPGDVLYVSHSRDEVCRLCGTVCVLTGGTGEGKEPVERLMGDPGTVSAALLSGCKNYSAIRVGPEGLVECLDWGVALRAGTEAPVGAAFAGVRAHCFHPAGPEDVNRIPCRVSRVIQEAFSTVVMLSTPGGSQGRSLVRMELAKEAWSGLGEPSELTLAVRPEHVMLLTGRMEI